jgi:hypothetical protein
MFLWFVTLSILGVFLVFRDPAMDYRLVALGAVLPDAIDVAIRQGIGPTHSVTFSVGVLALVMLASIGRRLLRRRLLAVSLGLFAHQILDGAWLYTRAFWWPFAGSTVTGSLPIVARGWLINVAMEAAGLLVGVYLWRRFRLDHPKRRSLFLAQGRIDRRLV